MALRDQIFMYNPVRCKRSTYKSSPNTNNLDFKVHDPRKPFYFIFHSAPIIMNAINISTFVLLYLFTWVECKGTRRSEAVVPKFSDVSGQERKLSWLNSIWSEIMDLLYHC